ncbi:uncharacterized protein PHACADRAFT_201301 [Phanerochaete carnosa HHB-10118-sp]|uniref:Uncharacterized protein n=1 Tax=Phanerochaete carnosa (strain HHB-10118-sp) TaxID=650164 RepID=K5VS37_PHACS|nr:uncharacterized protein PHACADRAFT_201301 [Phanerochaete carnosa HHB-10118-sp]EKM49590.1 hypothetical protein PHACADRAFT_201301 [Phanerochaete carnosa HHB-10118-sp]
MTRSIEELQAPEFCHNRLTYIIQQCALKHKRKREANQNCNGTLYCMQFTFSIDQPTAPATSMPCQKPDLKLSARVQGQQDQQFTQHEELTVFLPMAEAQRFWMYWLLTQLDTGAHRIACAHCIGQTQVMKVYWLICQGSIKNQMLEQIWRKLFLSLKAMNARTAAGNALSVLKTAKLTSIFYKGSSALACGNNGGGSGMGPTLVQFLKTLLADVLQASCKHDDVRALQVRRELDMSDAKQLPLGNTALVQTTRSPRSRLQSS